MMILQADDPDRFCEADGLYNCIPWLTASALYAAQPTLDFSGTLNLSIPMTAILTSERRYHYFFEIGYGSQ